jgi:hypothetical protein
VLAVYHHDTSRELDPQLHTHAVAANLTFDGAEVRWKALQASDIYERRAYLSEVYRNTLARQVRTLGYEIENQRDARGRDAGFEIRGVPAELLAKFSQRSHQRDRAIEAFVAERGRRPTDNEVAVLVRESRADKLTVISTRELRQKQRERITPDEEQMLAQARNTLSSPSMVADSSAPSLDYAQEHIFERVSVALDHELLTEALRHGRGRIRLGDLKGELNLQESAGKVLRSGREIATALSLERERNMIAAVNRGLGAFEPLGDIRSLVVSDRLRPEQKHAVEFVLQSRDRAVSISGAAGTGKTATLQELRRGLMEAGRAVLAVAPTMSAVEELQKVGFTDADRLLLTANRRETKCRITNGELVTVSAVDAAGRIQLDDGRSLPVNYRSFAHGYAVTAHHFAIGPYGNPAHQAVGSLIVFNDDEIWARSGNSEDVCHSAVSEILGGCGYLSGMPVDIRSKRRPRGKREQVRLHGPRSCQTRPKEIPRIFAPGIISLRFLPVLILLRPWAAVAETVLELLFLRHWSSPQDRRHQPGTMSYLSSPSRKLSLPPRRLVSKFMH